jgi:hypothetical protein
MNMTKLKPWYQVVTPREDLRDNRPLDASEFAVHLDHIRDRRPGTHVDYIEPARFFNRTHMTGSLTDLASQVLRRLSGIQLETSAVFNMATQFGGGKTHSLAALYHLAEHGDEAKSWKGVPGILSRAGLDAVPRASVAVIVGTEFDVLSGRGGDGEPIRKTPWAEVAWQLGGEKALAVVAEHDAKGIAPAGDVIRQMLPDGPVLVLMDELLHYMSCGRKLGLGNQLYNFLRSLGEEARARNNMALCVSIPSSSDVEMGTDDRHDYDSMKQMLDRLGKAILMSANTEMAEIIRRRLFDWGGLPDRWAQDRGGVCRVDEGSRPGTRGNRRRERLRPVRGLLSIPSGGAIGIRAEVAELAAVSAHPRRAAAARVVGCSQLPGRTSQGDERAAHHAGAGPARQSHVSRRAVRTAW